MLAILGIATACAVGPAPNEDQFRQAVTAQVVDGAKRSGPQVDGTDPVKVIVLDPTTLPADEPQLLNSIERGLSDAGVRWVKSNIGGTPNKLPGEWTTLGSSPLRFNRTHALLSLSITGKGRERTVKWSYLCGPVCGFGEETHFRWTANRWEATNIGVTVY